MFGSRLFCVGSLAFGMIGLGKASFVPLPIVPGPEPVSNIALVGDLSPPPADRIAGPGKPRRIARAADGLFYVTARVNGAKVRFLLDTGANMVVLTPADARRAGVGRGGSEAASDGMMRTAAGLSAIDRVSLRHVTIARRDVRQVDAVVARHGLTVSLLGQGVLSRLGPMTIAGDTITLD